MAYLEKQYQEIIAKLDTIANTIIEIAGNPRLTPEEPTYALDSTDIENMTLAEMANYIKMIADFAWNRGYHFGVDSGSVISYAQAYTDGWNAKKEGKPNPYA